MKKYIKNLILKKKWKNVCLFGKKSELDRRSIFNGRNKIGENTVLINTSLGFASYIGNDSFIKNCKIGKYTCIASNTKTICGTHPTKEYVSIHPAFYSNRKQIGISYVNENIFDEFKYIDKNNELSVVIGNDVWIGEDVRILEGVTIGDGAIIAAGSIVNSDVKEYSIVGGIPAKNIKMRFNESEIKFLKELKWWQKDEQWMIENAKYFKNIDLLIEKVNR